MSIRSRPTLLLDLDGVLVDPARGIIGCYRHALAAFDVTPAESDDLRWVIGPPIRQSFGRFLNAPDAVETAVRLYRERYAEWGLQQATAYPGVFDALAAQRARGARLILCTAKFHGFARRVVEAFGYAPLLSGVYGAELDGRFEDKGELIAHLLAAEGLHPDDVCMIGDRKHDVIAATANGVPAIGVLWGFGDREELESAGAALLAERPADLLPPGAA